MPASKSKYSRRRTAIRNVIDGASSILDSCIVDAYVLSHDDFHFVNDDAQAIFIDWVTTGEDIQKAIAAARAKLATAQPFLFPVEEVSPDDDE